MAKDTVEVTALRLHTHAGKEYHEGDTYAVEASMVESLVAQGMAKPTHEAVQAPAKPSQPVEPMTTGNTPIATASKPKK